MFEKKVNRYMATWKYPATIDYLEALENGPPDDRFFIVFVAGRNKAEARTRALKKARRKGFLQEIVCDCGSPFHSLKIEAFRFERVTVGA